MAAEAQELVFGGTDGGAVTDLAGVSRRGRLHDAREGARDDAGRGHRGDLDRRPARPRRRRVPDRPQVELHPEARPDPEAALPRRQRRRVGARLLQGPRDHGARPVHVPRGLPDRRARDRGEGGLRLHPRRVRRALRGAAFGARADAREGGASRRRHDRDPPRRRRVHLRRGDGAARVARGLARPAAHEAALPGDRGPLCLADRGQQRRVDRDRRSDPRAGRVEVREARRRELDRDARLLPQRHGRERRQLRGRVGDDAARADLRVRRRDPERTRS